VPPKPSVFPSTSCSLVAPHSASAPASRDLSSASSADGRRNSRREITSTPSMAAAAHELLVQHIPRHHRVGRRRIGSKTPAADSSTPPTPGLRWASTFFAKASPLLPAPRPRMATATRRSIERADGASAPPFQSARFSMFHGSTA
jgi:hypothetical protein